MKIEFDVKMTTSKMYDYMMYHTFHGMQGILGEMVGLLLMVAFFMTYKPLYLIFGLIVIFYLPVTLFFNAKKQVTLQPVFKEPLHYTLDEEGIKVLAGDQTDAQPWENMKKAVSTSKNIIVYTGKNTATLFPRADLGEKETEAIKIISMYMDPKKVNIRI